MQRRERRVADVARRVLQLAQHLPRLLLDGEADEARVGDRGDEVLPLAVGARLAQAIEQLAHDGLPPSSMLARESTGRPAVDIMNVPLAVAIACSRPDSPS